MRRTLLPVLLLSALAMTGCGNATTTEVRGAVGVGVDAEGRVIAVVVTCGADLDEVTLYGGREGLEGDEPNPILATGTVDPTGQPIVTAFLTPTSGGGQLRLGDLDRTGLHILSAQASESDTESGQVTFRADDLDALEVDQVVTGDGTTSTPQQLRAGCDSD